MSNNPSLFAWYVTYCKSTVKQHRPIMVIVLKLWDKIGFE